jgi:hypothetical protein
MSYILRVSVGSTYLKDNVTDVEDRQDLVVVVALQPQIRLKTGQTSIADVGAVDEAEKVQQSYCGNNIEINLPSQLGFRLGVECKEGIAVAVEVNRSSVNVL